MKLVGKIIIKGLLVTETGLHLGGSKSSLKIGSIDNGVIKTALDVPYIPGSSLKGKLRSLLAKVEGSLFFSKDAKIIEEKVIEELIKKEQAENPDSPAVTELTKYKAVLGKSTTDEDCEYIMELFGYSGDSTRNDRVLFNRLLVRDSFLKNGDDPIFHQGYTDSKWENVIDRKTGTALNPRQTERVPVGAAFGLELVYNIYDDAQPGTPKFKSHLGGLLLALELLQDDGIGGNISRGYGKVSIRNVDVVYKSIHKADMKYASTSLVAQPNALLSAFSQKFPQTDQHD